MLDLKKNYKDRRVFIIVLALIIALIGVGVYANNEKSNYQLAMQK